MLVSLLPLFLLSLAVANASPFEDETLHIPLTRRALRLKTADGEANVTAIAQEAARLSNKYQRNRRNLLDNINSDMRKLHKIRRGMTTLANPSDLVWTGTIKVGTPAKAFTVTFDTGSSDLTLPDSTCTNCNSKARYTLSSSSSGSATGGTTSAKYADGSVTSGKIVTDTVQAGGLTIPSQSFISATTLGTTMAASSADGLMGMAFASLSSMKTKSVPFSISGLGMGSYFSVSLSDTAGKSFVSFGTTPRATPGTGAAQVSVAPDATSGFYTYWQVAGGAPFVDGSQAIATRVNHIIDTGAVLISAPLAAAAEFWAKVPGSKPYPAQAGFYTYPCQSTMQVSFSLGNGLDPININMADFNLGYIDSAQGNCVGGIIGQNLGIGSAWLLGEVFIKNYYVIFNMNKPSMSFISK